MNRLHGYVTDGSTGDSGATGGVFDWLLQAAGGLPQPPDVPPAGDKPYSPPPLPSGGIPGVTVPGPGATTPGAVAFRPGNWDPVHVEYVIAQGDTEVGLAATYLGSGARHMEIRALQTHTDGEMGPNGPYLNKDTSKFFPGSTAPGSYWREGAVLVMPQEALDKAQELLGDKTFPRAPATPGAPATKPAKDRPPALGQGGTTPSSVLHTTVGGVEVWKLALAGVAGYAVYKLAF